MASVWAQEKGEKVPRKVAGNLTPEAARRAIRVMVQSWKQHRGPVVQVWDSEYLVYEGQKALAAGKPTGSLFVEFFSPPSRPEPGQPHAKVKPAPDVSRSAGRQG